MNTIIESKQYFLTSNSLLITKNNGSFNSDVSFYLPYLIRYNKNILYHTLKISHLEIPYSFYIVNIYNNLLVVNNTPIYIPTGNYNAITLMNIINELLDEVFIFNITLSFIDVNGKYILTSDNPITINTDSTIYKVIGLELGYNYNGIIDFTTNKYIIEFPFLVNTSGIRNILLKSNLITNNVHTFKGDSTILKSIPVSVPPFGIIQYVNNENMETVIKNRELNNIDIQLLDDDANLINFNNIDWSICLEIKTISQLSYNYNNINDFFEKLNESN